MDFYTLAHMAEDCILILTPGFPASEEDTSCLPPVQQFCLCLKDEFPAIKIVVVSTQYPFSRTNYKWHGISVFAAGGANGRGVRRLFTWLRTMLVLRDVGKRYNVGAVLSLWLGEAALLGSWFARRRKLRHLIWLQGQDAKAGNKYVRRIRPQPASLVAISRFVADELHRNHGLRPASIVANGIVPALFPPLNINERDIDILGVGSLIPLKNYEAFVRIIHRLSRERPALRAVIAGSGPEERGLSELSFRLGLAHNLKFVGQVPHAEVLRLMNRSRYFLHPSTYEGHSTVLLEALYSGCVTISAQPVSDHALQRFHLCATEDDMLNVLRSVEPGAPERVLVNDMRHSAREMGRALLKE